VGGVLSGNGVMIGKRERKGPEDDGQRLEGALHSWWGAREGAQRC
jgi:hypothetical protein